MLFLALDLYYILFPVEIRRSLLHHFSLEDLYHTFSCVWLALRSLIFLASYTLVSYTFVFIYRYTLYPHYLYYCQAQDDSVVDNTKLIIDCIRVQSSFARKIIY